MKRRLSSILLILAFFAGVALLLYPSVANYWNEFHSSRAIAGYSEAVAKMSDEERQRYIAEAEEFNAELAQRTNLYSISDEQLARYNKLLNVDGNGVMGYVEIPSIKVSLPLYHGTSDTVLRMAVGHLEWSSLPVGGESTHAVLSGHRGLPSAKLFTNLDKLSEGDVFMLCVLDEVLTYEVDQILITEPQEIGDLIIEDGKDYCTLVTCTPYGINTHRLLVRGHRVDNIRDASDVRITSEAMQVESMLVASFFAVPILLALLIILLVKRPAKKPDELKKRNKKGKKNNNSTDNSIVDGEQKLAPTENKTESNCDSKADSGPNCTAESGGGINES